MSTSAVFTYCTQQPSVLLPLDTFAFQKEFYLEDQNYASAMLFNFVFEINCSFSYTCLRPSKKFSFQFVC